MNRTRWIPLRPLLAAMLFLTLGLAQELGKPKEAPMDTQEAQSPKPQVAKAEAAPLLLDPATYRLAPGLPGQAYTHTLRGIGGTPKYTFQLTSGTLPEGLRLTPDGVLAGTPAKVGRAVFTVCLTDTRGQTAAQQYVLVIRNPEPAKPPAAPGDLPGSQASLDYDQVRVFKLPKTVLDQLVPKEPEATSDGEDGGAAPPRPNNPSPPPAPLPALPEAQIAQLKQILTPLLEREYPTRSVFESALDEQVCVFARGLVKADAASRHQPAPSPDVLDRIKPPDWAAVAKAGRTLVPDVAKPERLPEALMPFLLRAWLVAQAAQEHSLTYDTPINWTGAGCGTVINDTPEGQVYGFYPIWWAQGTPQTLDFSVLNRISFFALPFDDEGNLRVPEDWTYALTRFIREANLHDTRLDFTLYRGDWRFLGSMSEVDQNRLIQNLSRSAVALIHTPLPDFVSRVKSYVPFFRDPQEFAEGLTLWMEEPSEPALRKPFHRFYKTLVNGLIDELGKSDESAVLNLVMPDYRVAVTGGFEIDPLFEFLKYAEKPVFEDGRIKLDVAQESRTNITLRYVVVLSAPTTDSKKRLRQRVEEDPALAGNNRKTFLRKIIPVIPSIGDDLLQLKDDLVYFGDNFGGVGFWPVPIAEEHAPKDLHTALISTFSPPDESPPSWVSLWGGEWIRRWVSEHRWPLRILFEALVALGTPILLMLLWNRRVSDFSQVAQFGLLGLLLLIVVVGGLLLGWDPALGQLRESNVLLWMLIASLFLVALVTLLKPRIEKP